MKFIKKKLTKIDNNYGFMKFLPLMTIIKSRITQNHVIKKSIKERYIIIIIRLLIFYYNNANVILEINIVCVIRYLMEPEEVHTERNYIDPY